LFFFSSRRRHTRFSRDWSSDVCSSDLGAGPCAARSCSKAGVGLGPATGLAALGGTWTAGLGSTFGRVACPNSSPAGGGAWRGARSEERRVGKECRSRWGRFQQDSKRKE